MKNDIQASGRPKTRSARKVHTVPGNRKRSGKEIGIQDKREGRAYAGKQSRRAAQKVSKNKGLNRQTHKKRSDGQASRHPLSREIPQKTAAGRRASAAGASRKRRDNIRSRKRTRAIRAVLVGFAAALSVVLVFTAVLAVISAAVGIKPEPLLAIASRRAGSEMVAEGMPPDAVPESLPSAAAGPENPEQETADGGGLLTQPADGSGVPAGEEGETPGFTELVQAADAAGENEGAAAREAEQEIQAQNARDFSNAPAVSVNVGQAAAPAVVHLVAVGDNLMHRSVSMSGLKDDGSYNYDYNFSKVAPYISAADLAIINQETVIGGNELGIQGYPNFNGRTEMADALAKVGFDVVLGANNHILDQGVNPVIHMIRYFNTHYPQISVLGIHGSWEARDDLVIREVNGIRIAMINYTDLLNIPSYWYGNEYSVEYLDYDRLAALIARAKAASDFVIVFPHWGTEYFLGVDQKEQEEAGFLAAQGVDLVIGTHPHVVEPVSYVTRPDGGQMLIYYSLGNYQSIQNLEETMIGGMAQVEITKGYNGKARITDFNMEFLANDYRMSGRFLDYYDIVTTYPWELYSRDLAETSWVHHDNENFSVDKMFSIQAQMAAQVATERANAGMPRH